MFTNAFHTTPLCAPNRASILTGQYASRHGIIDKRRVEPRRSKACFLPPPRSRRQPSGRIPRLAGL